MHDAALLWIALVPAGGCLAGLGLYSLLTDSESASRMTTN